MKKGLNLRASYNKVNEDLSKLFDERGVPRNWTVPFVEGHDMAAHIKAVGSVADDHGTLAASFVTSAHHAGGRGQGSADGSTQGHSVDKLRQVHIPANDEKAIRVIADARSLLNQISELLGKDEPTVVTARSQLSLAARSNGQGMTLYDFAVLIIQLLHPPVQAVAQRHALVKAHHTGNSKHLMQRTGPRHGMPPEESEEGDDEEQPESEATPQGGAASSSAAPPANAAPANAAPAPAGLARPGAAMPQNTQQVIQTLQQKQQGQ
jgi:hypothetical protein